MKKRKMFGGISGLDPDRIGHDHPGSGPGGVFGLGCAWV